MPRRASGPKAKATGDMESPVNSQSTMFDNGVVLNIGEFSDVPEGWTKTTLGDIAHVFAGGSAPQGEQWFGGKKPFIRVQHLTEGDDWVKRWDLITDTAVKAHRLKLFPKGTIVLPKSGASIRLEKRAILTADAYLVSHLAAIIPQQNVVYPDFLFYTLRSKRLAKEKADGYPTLNLSELNLTPISLPPLPEQRAIATVLRTVQQAKESSERVIAATRQLKQSLIKYLFTYGPVPFDQADQVPLKETEIGLMPEHWPLCKLGDVIEKPQYGLTASASETAIGPRFLRITDIQDGSVNWNSVPFCECSQEDYDKFAIGKGDIVVARIGATTGKTFLVKASLEAVFASYLIRIRAKGVAEPEFIYRFTETTSYWKQIDAAKGGRLKQGVNIPVLRGLLIPNPPISEQKVIAEKLSALDSKLAAEEARRSSLANLFQSLLHHLMTGKVRVTS